MKSHYLCDQLSRYKTFASLCLLLCMAAFWPTQALAAPVSLAQNLFITTGGATSSPGQGSIIEITTTGAQVTFATNLFSPYGMVFDTSGNLYVADSGDGIIYEYTNGYKLGQTPVVFANNLTQPIGLAMDSQGNLYESDGGSAAIYEFPKGYKVGQTPTTFVNNSSETYDLYGLAFDSSGDLFAADYDSGTIYKFPKGYQSSQTPGTFASGLASPNDLAFDSSGNLLVADMASAYVYKYNTSGTQSIFTSGLSGPTGAACDLLGDVSVSEQGSGVVYYYPAGGARSTLATELNPTYLLFQPPAPISTTLSVQSSPNSPVFGQSVTLTATVNHSAPSASTPTGTVNFYFGTTSLGSGTVSGGLATLTVSNLAGGTQVLQTFYSGDTNFLASSNAIFLTVNQAATSTELTAAPNPTAYGQPATLTATVTATPPGTGAVNGAVTFYNGATSLGSSTLSGGTATLTVSNLPVGTNNLTAVYAINGDYTGSTSTSVAQVVTPPPAAPPVQNLFVANLGNNPGQGSITEIMTNGTQLLFATNLDYPFGMAFDGSGNLYVADYGSDTIYEYPNGYQSGQTPKIFATNLNGPIGLTMDSQGNLFEADGGSGSIYEFTNGYTLGQPPVTFATNLINPISLTGLAFDNFGNLFAGNDGSGSIFEFPKGYQPGQTPITFATNLFAPTGLTFDGSGNLFVTDGNGNIDKFATNGTRSVFVSGLNLATGLAFDSFGNLYEGDLGSGNVYAFIPNGTPKTFATGLNPTFLAFGPLTTTLLVQSSANPTVFGQSVTLTATVSPSTSSARTPAGTVNFFDGATSLGSGAVSNNVATLTVSSLTVGTHNLQAIYSGDANFLTSSNSVIQTVDEASTSTELAASPNPTAYGQSATLTATVTVVAPGTGMVGGTVTFYNGGTSLGSSTLSNGVAILNVSSLPTGINNLTAAYADNGSYSGSTSTTVTQVVNQAATTVSVQSSVSPSVFGQSVMFTATVTAISPGAGTPTGIVDFSDGATDLGIGTVSNGVATLTISSLSVGTHNILMSYSGDANFLASSDSIGQVVNPAETTNVLTVAPNPTVYGQVATLTATLTAIAPGSGTVDGNVTFYDNGVTSLGSGTLNNGVATLNISSLLAGTHSLTAVYAGSVNYGNSASAVAVQVVNQAETGLAGQTSVSPSVFGQSVTFTATVTNAVATGGSLPTGTVDFSDGTTNIGGGTLVNGVATVTVSSLSVGTHDILMSYSGDPNFLASSNAVSQVVNPAGTTNVLTVAPNPTVYGQTATLTAVVTPVVPGVGTVGGTVTFYDGATSLGSSTLNGGVATLNVSSLLAGNHSLTAVYTGSVNYSNSTSAVVMQLVNQAATTLAAQTSLSSTVYGQSVTFTATLTAVAPGAGTPTGNVSFFDGTTNLGNGTLNSGVATLAVSTLAVGTHTIQMNYSGDTNFVASSSSVGQVVNQALTSAALAVTSNPTVYGQVVTLTATMAVMAPGAGTVPDSVTFYNGATSLGSGTLTNDVATLDVSNLPAGTNSLTVVYTGNGDFYGSTSAVVTEVVNQAESGLVGETSVSPSVFGQSVTFTATVTNAVATGGDAPTGTVDFFDGVTNIGSGTMSNGVATLTVSSLSVGTHDILMSYSGDANFFASSNDVSQVVIPAETTNVLTASPTSGAVYSQMIMLTATVTAVAPGSGTVGGNVIFFDGGTNLGSSTLSGGVATLNISSLLAGSHNLTAVYTGSVSYTNSSSAVMTYTVAQANTFVTAQSSLANSTFGQSVTLTAIVTASTPATGTPTGTVDFFDGTTNLESTTMSNGVATLTVSRLAVGTHTIQMNYSGDANFVASSGLLVGSPQVSEASTITALAVAPNPTVYGQTAMLTATVTAVAPGAGTVCGTVTFYDGGAGLGSATLSNGVVTLNISNLLAGSHSLTAAYADNGSYSTSTSAVVTQVVNQAETSLAGQTSVSPSVFGQSVTFTATVTNAVATGGTLPTGAVDFFDGMTNIGSGTISNGVATLTISSLNVGTHDILMSYSGDANFLVSSNDISQVVNPAATTNVLAVSPNPTVYGQAATLTATVTVVAPGAGTVGGNVKFYDGVTTLGTGTLTNGVAALNVSSLLAGNHNLTALYCSNGSYSNSTSTAVTLVVNQAATTNVVVSSINPSVPGLPVTYTATVNAVAPGAGTPTGTMTFYYGTNIFGTNILIDGIASVTNAFLPVGTNLVTAVYSGDANFLASTTPALTQTVISLTSSQALATGVVDHSGTVFLQSGLMLQYITVSNVTAGTYSAVRVTLHLTQSGITVYDATGTNANGDAYVQYNYPVLPHSSVTFAVEYYVANRTTIPNPTISVTLVSPQAPLPVPKGTTVQIVQRSILSVPDSFLVGFQTQLNATYDVLYSSDMVNWTVVVPAVKGNGSEVQWLDLGPPLTQSPPSATTHRCYQIIKVQ